MALADILEKIVKEAELRAEEIKVSADAEVVKIETLNEADFAEQEKKLAKVYAQEKADMGTQAVLQAKMEARSQNLKQKREIIEKALQEIVVELNKISGEDYQKFLKNLFKDIAKEFQNVEIIPADGRETETKKAVAEFENLKLAKTVGKFKGGFIAKADKAEVDATFENLVMHTYRNQLELIISQELFA